MSYRAVAVAPFVLLACTAALTVLVPESLRPVVVQLVVDLSKVLAFAGMATAALAFDRGDYLRRGWGVWAACYACLLARDAMLLAAGHVSPAVYEWTRGVLVSAGNLFVVVGAWTLARAWTVAGLEHPGPKGTRRAVVAVAVVVALAFAGPTLLLDVHEIALGPRMDFDSIASDLGDILSLPLIAPVALTALAVREGTLRWPWMLLTSSLVAWLLYDALYTLPDYFVVASPSRYHLVSEQFHMLAGACAGAAGLTQRMAVTEADEEV
jgi:hypothetical protein